MKFEIKDPPRKFMVGNGQQFPLYDWGTLHLAADELVTLKTDSGAEYDVARKDWGFYATPSINGRLLSFGLRTVLVKNPLGRFFIFLVEAGHEESFYSYAASESNEIICWLDDETLGSIEDYMKSKKSPGKTEASQS